MYCIFCYVEFFDTGTGPTELNTRRKNRLKIFQAFCNTIHRTLGVQSKSALGKDALESCCTNCLHIINNYCKVAFQTQCLQLQLNWQTEQLLKVIKMGDANGVCRKRFRENYINSEEVPIISTFRNEIVEKSVNEIQRKRPKVLLDRINHAMLKPQVSKTFKVLNFNKDVHKNKRDKVQVKATALRISTVTSLQEISRHAGKERKSILNESIIKVKLLPTPECSNEVEVPMKLDEVKVDSNSLALCVETEPKTEVDYDDNEACSQETSEPKTFIPVAELAVYEEPCIGDSDKLSFLSPSNDTEHEVAGSSFVCYIPGCGKSFDNQNSYQWHHIQHQGRLSMVTCPYPDCEKSFLNDNFLRQHMKIHKVAPLPSPAIQKKWTCNKCNMQYSTKFNLRRHVVKQHLSEKSIKQEPKEIIVPPRKQQRVIGVGSLQRMFKKSDQSFRQIVRWRSPEYRCTICDRMCRNSFKLNEHMRTHSGERPFGCVFCTWKFGTKSNLKRHVRLVHKIQDVFEPKSES